MRLKPAATDNNLASQVLQVLFIKETTYNSELDLLAVTSQFWTSPAWINRNISAQDLCLWLDQQQQLLQQHTSGSLPLGGYTISKQHQDRCTIRTKTILHLTQYESTIMMLYYLMQTTCFKPSSFHNLFSVNIYSGFGTLEPY